MKDTKDSNREAVDHAPDARALDRDVPRSAMADLMARVPPSALRARLLERRRRQAADKGGPDAAAAQGMSGSGGALPHADAIQRSFGAHDVGGIAAHTDAAAASAASALGAEAYASGEHVAFAGSPSLHDAAHEAAHVVQQRGGAAKEVAGQPGDAMEQHADAVADRVVRNESAADLLDSVAKPGDARAPDGRSVQYKVKIGPDTFDDYATFRDTFARYAQVFRLHKDAVVDAVQGDATQAFGSVEEFIASLTGGGEDHAVNAQLASIQELYFNERLDEKHTVNAATRASYRKSEGLKATGETDGPLRFRGSAGNADTWTARITTDAKVYHVRLLRYDRASGRAVLLPEPVIVKSADANKPTARGRSDKIGGVTWGLTAAPDAELRESSAQAHWLCQRAAENNLQPDRFRRTQPDGTSEVIVPAGVHGWSYRIWAPASARTAVPRPFGSLVQTMLQQSHVTKNARADSRYQAPDRETNPYGIPATQVGRHMDRLETSTVSTAEYEWCHLIGHGDGGKERFGNFVVGTVAVNTEQLAMEGTLRKYRAAYAQSGASIRLDVRVALRRYPTDPRLNPGGLQPTGDEKTERATTANVADVIYYAVSVVNSRGVEQFIYSRTMDARRQRITYEEVVAIETVVANAFERHLAGIRDGRFT